MAGTTQQPIEFGGEDVGEFEFAGAEQVKESDLLEGVRSRGDLFGGSQQRVRITASSGCRHHPDGGQG